MYTAYFGLKEKPFSIAPDPQYLFMSDRHREALAHLTYGLGDAGGFVLLTGEVGTGKTTVSRCLMERLPDNTQAAFILNPTLSSHELLATICDELKIRYRKTGATLKTLTDKIQDKLLKNHKADTNTLLIIDEAQHLQPEVLEQLRLLTNLETNTKKLLQVILIGQPELQTLLKRRDLRQLAQRITARYHLLPLNKQEVAQYIKHRLSIADGIRALFSPSAMRTIYKVCEGTPRLINLVCERSLINAYNSNIALVNKKIVLLSAKEALGEEHLTIARWKSSVFFVALMIMFSGLIASSAYFFGVSSSASQLDISAQAIQAPVLESNPASTEKTDESNGAIKAQAKKADKAKETEQITNSIPIKKEKKKSENVKSPSEVKIQKEINEQASVLVTPEVEVEAEVKISRVEGVSEELLEQFKEAINDQGPSNEDVEAENQFVQYQSIDEMPLWVQNGVPKLQFEQHIYASDGQGWIKVNGRDRYEGDSIARELTLVEILPQKVVLSFRGEKFTMNALSSW